MPMNDRELECFKHFLKAYKFNWDQNDYARLNYDEDLDFYLSYRNSADFPLAFNMSFNKLLPRIMTVLSRFMEQLYQAGTGNLVSVRPRKRADVESAPRVEGLLNFQLENLNSIDMSGGSYLFNFEWMFNALTFGKGISKLLWKKEERIAPQRITIPIPRFAPNGQLIGMEPLEILRELPQVMYDGPYAEVIHNKLFVPDVRYKNIQKMPFAFLVYKRSLDYVDDMRKKGIWKNVDQLGWHPSGHASANITGLDSGEAYARSIDIEGVTFTDEFVSDYSTAHIDIAEGYGKYIFPEDDTPYEVGAGYKIKGKESDAICHIGNYSTLLSIQKNSYGKKPLFDISAYMHPELYWDIGIIRLGKDIQRQVDNLGNVRFQNAIQLVNQMLKVREDADIPQEALIWKPFGIIPVEDMDDVQPLIQPDVSQSNAFKEQEEFFDATLSDMTGMYPYGMGQTPPRQEYVGTMYSLQSMGEARTKLLMMTMDHQGFQPFLRYMMLLNSWHLPSNFEFRKGEGAAAEFPQMFAGDIHPEYDFTARYTSMEPALGKQMRANQLIQYAQMWQGSPYLQQYQFMRAVLEMLDFPNTDQFLRNDQQVAQMMNQQQQQQMQMQMAGMAMQGQQQGQLQSAQQEGELIRDVVKSLLK
jgi:hypothetical protein